MASIRLTTSIKEQLERELIRYRFSEEASTLVGDYAQLAHDVYDDVYSELTRKKMEALPKGWLPHRGGIGVQFGDIGSSYAELNFSGKCYGEISYAGGREGNDRGANRLVPYSDVSGCTKRYEATDPMAERYDSLEARYKDLEERIRVAKKVARSAMDSVTTINRLKEVWPEIAPFTERFETRPNQLPTISRPDLNGILGLPVETKEKAA